MLFNISEQLFISIRIEMQSVTESNSGAKRYIHLSEQGSCQDICLFLGKLLQQETLYESMLSLVK